MNALQFSLTEKLALYFKGGNPILYIAFLFLGPYLFQVGGGTNVFLEMKFEYGELGFARGYVTRVLETDKTEYGEPVFQYDYSFPIGLETLYGTSFSSEFYFQEGNRVQIEYLLDDPQTSRMYGAYFADYILLSFLGIGLFFIGLISIPVRLNSVKHKMRFLEDGKLVKADFEAVRPTGIEIEEENQYHFSYSYTVGDKSYHLNRKTTNPYGKNQDEYLVYSYEDPTDVVFLSDLPSSVANRVKSTYKEAE